MSGVGVDDAAVAATDADTAVRGPAPEPVDDAGAPASTGGGRGQRRPVTLERIIAWLLVIIGVRMGLGPLGDNSFLTHLSTGRIILDTHHVPTTDPYSFSAHGSPWTVQSWLASVIYAGTERVAGFGGIRVLVAVLMVATLLGVWRLTRPAEGLLARLLPMTMVLAVASLYWSERPLLFGLVGLTLVLRAADGDLDPRWLVPVMWIWVNTHGSFPFAPGILVLLAIGRRLDGESCATELRALRWTLLGVALAAINPLGPKLLLFPLSMLERREAFSYVVEWSPLRFDDWVSWVFALQVLVAIVAVGFRRRSWRAILPVLAFTAAALMSRRNVTQASIVLAFAAAPGLAGLGRIPSTEPRPGLRPFAVVVPVLAALIALMGLAGPNLDLSSYPVAATTWAQDHDLIDGRARVLSTDVAGGYLEARYGPDGVRVFIDDRVDMFPLPVVQDLVTLRRGGTDAQYRAILARQRPTVVLWPANDAFGRWLRTAPGWTVRHRAGGWVVAVPTPSDPTE